MARGLRSLLRWKKGCIFITFGTEGLVTDLMCWVTTSTIMALRLNAMTQKSKRHVTDTVIILDSSSNWYSMASKRCSDYAWTAKQSLINLSLNLGLLLQIYNLSQRDVLIIALEILNRNLKLYLGCIPSNYAILPLLSNHS